MNPSYARIRLPLAQAMERFSNMHPNELAPATEVSSLEAVDLAVENGVWRGGAKFVYENDGWTVFEDLSGHLGGRSAASWLEFAGDDDFVFSAASGDLDIETFLSNVSLFASGDGSSTGSFVAIVAKISTP